MITVTLPSNGKQIGLRFHHIHKTRLHSLWAVDKPNPRYEGPIQKAADKRTTICQIVDTGVNPATPIATAEVVWNPMDRFSKLAGQKRALTMALDYLLVLGGCSKTDRATIWKAFWGLRRAGVGGNHTLSISAQQGASGKPSVSLVDILETGERLQAGS